MLMDRRAFLGVAAAAGLAVGPTALAAGQVIGLMDAADALPTTIAEFDEWLKGRFTVAGWFDEGAAAGLVNHGFVASKSVEWLDHSDEIVMAAERQCVRSAALRIQSAIDLNPKAFGADLWLRLAPRVFVERVWDGDVKFMKLRLRFSCSEPLPGITSGVAV
jgi:hypothetical protein